MNTQYHTFGRETTWYYIVGMVANCVKCHCRLEPVHTNRHYRRFHK